MGSCCSINESNRVRKPSINKSRRSHTLSSHLTNNPNSISELKGSQNEDAIKSSFNIYHKNDKLNGDLNILISKYGDKLSIKKLNYIQLYNIFMNYIYDFSNSNFIICDTREELKDRQQLFLKKFNQINYSLRQIETMSNERSSKFFNYLKNKNIIFILKDESSLELMEKFFIYFIANNKGGKLIKNIYILSEYIQIYNKDNLSNTYLDYLYYFIDEDIIYQYSPKILINTNDIKSTNLNNDNINKNNSYVFVNTYPHSLALSNDKKGDNNRAINKFDINYICNKNTEEPDLFLNFVAKFNIYYILNFVLSNEDNINNNSKLITHSEAKRNKVGKEDKKILIKQKNVIIPKNIVFDQFYGLIRNDFFQMIEEFENEVIDNYCILVQFDSDIDIIFKSKLIYIIISRITELSFDDIYNYIKNNFFDIENEELILSKKDEIIKSIS